MKKVTVAVIGSREPTKEQQRKVIDMISVLDPTRHIIISGCADGMDAIGLETGYELGFDTTGILPWNNYNPHVQKYCSHLISLDTITADYLAEAYQSVKDYHPAAHRLSQGALKLHARNYLIVRWANWVIAAPSNKPGGGGTGQGIRLVHHLDIPITIIKP